MTPEKTNYITQGVDGQKRLKQGPDLASYRGLSVIHSRAFSLETGQEPRDILRRRVRTAEYYRILPHKNNRTREFELYNEARDTWFALTFQDLLAFARLDTDPVPMPATGGHFDFHLDDPWGYRGVQMPRLGAMSDDARKDAKTKARDMTRAVVGTPLYYLFTNIGYPVDPVFESRADSAPVTWTVYPFTSSLGMRITAPRTVPVYGEVSEEFMVVSKCRNIDFARHMVLPDQASGLFLGQVLTSRFDELKTGTLHFPFVRGTVETKNPGQWWLAYSFYHEVLRRGGVPMNMVAYDFDNWKGSLEAGSPLSEDELFVSYMMALKHNTDERSLGNANVVDLYLAPDTEPSINHELNFFDFGNDDMDDEYSSICRGSMGGLLARNLILTVESAWYLHSSDEDGNMWGYNLLTPQDFGSLNDECKRAFEVLMLKFSQIVKTIDHIFTIKCIRCVRCRGSSWMG